eukprot:286223-Rhodomonas_salina.4
MRFLTAQTTSLRAQPTSLKGESTSRTPSTLEKADRNGIDRSIDGREGRTRAAMSWWCRASP